MSGIWEEDDDLPEGFFNDAYLPLQFFSSSQRTGERNLMAAIVRHAIMDIRSGQFVSTAGGQKNAREAQEWVESDDDFWLYHFCSICTHLEIDVSYARERIRRYLEVLRQHNRRVPRRPVYLNQQLSRSERVKELRNYKKEAAAEEKRKKRGTA